MVAFPRFRVSTFCECEFLAQKISSHFIQIKIYFTLRTSNSVVNFSCFVKVLWIDSS